MTGTPARAVLSKGAAQSLGCSLELTPSLGGSSSSPGLKEKSCFNDSSSLKRDLRVMIKL